MYTVTPQGGARRTANSTEPCDPNCFRKPQRITITVSWGLYQQLATQSDDQGRSLSNLACYWLEQQAEQQAQAPGRSRQGASS